MFDQLIEAKRSKRRPAVTVALAAAVHAGAVVVALWATRPEPVPEEPRQPDRPLVFVDPSPKPPGNGGPDKSKGNRPPAKRDEKRPLRVSKPERTEQTIDIKPEPSDAPVVETAPVENAIEVASHD